MSEQAVGFLRARLTGVANERHQERIDAECSTPSSPTFTHTNAAWEQRYGHARDRSATARQPLPRVRSNEPSVIAQIDAAIERDLEACREILRRQK
jgi:hypothetical protein